VAGREFVAEPWDAGVEQTARRLTVAYQFVAAGVQHRMGNGPLIPLGNLDDHMPVVLLFTVHGRLFVFDAVSVFGDAS
jgi:hypothetical protein